ncbi:MAG: DUF4412 domain-containing protein [Gemmatimonadetes bacterium]|nr:DUF4412 domain-containing protein [Gemmatimonadota bacterium]
MLRPALLLAVLATPLAAQSFEGAIAMTVTSDNGKANALDYLVKGSKLRMEMAGGRGGPMVVIFDMAERKMLMMMDAQKMYMEQSIPDPAPIAEKAKPAKIARTGKTETIAGYTCEHVIVTEADASTSDVCVAKGLGTWRMPGGGRGGPPKEPEWQSGLGDGGFPLKVQKGDKVMVEVTKVDKKTLDAALFAPPAGYQKFDMGAMMRKRP